MVNMKFSFRNSWIKYKEVNASQMVRVLLRKERYKRSVVVRREEPHSMVEMVWFF